MAAEEEVKRESEEESKAGSMIGEMTVKIEMAEYRSTWRDSGWEEQRMRGRQMMREGRGSERDRGKTKGGTNRGNRGRGRRWEKYG